MLKIPDENGTALGGPGRKVVFGIRPENITRHDPERPGRRQVGLLDAPVEVVEPTGAETMVVLRVGETEVIARFEPDDAPDIGDTVTLAVDLAKACVFDRETERLL